MAEWERSKGNESPDPFGLRSAMQRKMEERGDDPASRARAEAEAASHTEVSDAEIAELLGPDSDAAPDQK
jgi:hypothetical protein